MKEDLDQLHRELGLKRLHAVWAKAEILIGLTVAGAAIMSERHELLPRLALFVLGAYLAMAGHRSHIYQSSNRLTAYLARLCQRSDSRLGD